LKTKKKTGANRREICRFEKTERMGFVVDKKIRGGLNQEGDLPVEKPEGDLLVKKPEGDL